MKPVLLNHKFYYFGPYLTEMQIDPNYCAKLLKLGKKLKQSHRKHLAGQIYHEYVYPLKTEPWIFNEFKIYIDTWIEGWKQFSARPKFSPGKGGFELTDMWINQMKAKEFNPIHFHGDCDLSFVLWLEVPQQMLDEAKTNPTNSFSPGSIMFIYGENAWSVIAERYFIPSVNTLMIFPANLRHEVLGFNSKVTRTSVSGNIKFT